MVENEIYAMPILMMENDESTQDFEFRNWTRVRCNKIINPKFIQGDLLETGETSKKVAIKNFELNLQWTSISLLVFCGYQVGLSKLAPFSQRQKLSPTTFFC